MGISVANRLEDKTENGNPDVCFTPLQKTTDG